MRSRGEGLLVQFHPLQECRVLSRKLKKERTQKDKQEKEKNSQISHFRLDESDSKKSIKQGEIKTKVGRICVYNIVFACMCVSAYVLCSPPDAG